VLVLTRKVDESIVIGDNIEVTIVAVRGDQVRVGIEAPRSLPVFRKEIYLEIRDENVRAAGSAARSDIGALLSEVDGRASGRRSEKHRDR